jgi:hypothetical protein
MYYRTDTGVGIVVVPELYKYWETDVPPLLLRYYSDPFALLT